MSKRSEAIKAFLEANTHADLAAMYHSGMEVQINAAQDDAQRVERSFEKEGKKVTYRVWTDGKEEWASFRLPRNAKVNPEDNDSTMRWSLADHADGIGCTGWDWKGRKSVWLGYDFDALVSHKTGLTAGELDAVQKAACAIPWVTVRLSTSGKGLHLYVFLDPPLDSINHTEHAAAARAVLGQMSAAAGFDFSAKIDCVGSVLWLWHRKMRGTDGLKLVKQGEPLGIVPINWRDHIPLISGKRQKSALSHIKGGEREQSEFEQCVGQYPKVQLDEQHKALIAYLESIHAHFWWDHDRHLLVAHTLDLKKAHIALNCTGVFETSSSGSTEYNSFCVPAREGKWIIRRFGKGVQEHPTWDRDASGFACCDFNKEVTLELAAKMNGGKKQPNGAYHFNRVEGLTATLALLGIEPGVPDFLLNGRRRGQLKAKNRELHATIDGTEGDEAFESDDWVFSARGGRRWQRLFVYNPPVADEASTEFLDEMVRHTNSKNEGDATKSSHGWLIRSNGEWINEPKSNAHDFLRRHFSGNDLGQAMSTLVAMPWQLTCEPFKPEYPGNRIWNLNAPQLRFSPSQQESLSFPTWEQILQHVGSSLTPTIEGHNWCRLNGIINGRDYLFAWIAAFLRLPTRHLPYLFLYSGDERTGKSTFHESIARLITGGCVRGDHALTGDRFNGELAGAILCVIEETDLGKNKRARNKIKDWVTSPYILVEPKGQSPYMAKNNLHFIQCANDPRYCPVFPGDTRITAIRVPALKELIQQHALHTLLDKEAPEFLGAIFRYEVPISSDPRLAIPVIDTHEKHELATENCSPPVQFLKEMYHCVPGCTIKYGVLYEHFVEWYQGNASDWGKQTFGRELPDYYPKGRWNGADYYVGNISNDPRAEPGKRLILRGDRLVEES